MFNFYPGNCAEADIYHSNTVLEQILNKCDGYSHSNQDAIHLLKLNTIYKQIQRIRKMLDKMQQSQEYSCFQHLLQNSVCQLEM